MQTVGIDELSRNPQAVVHDVLEAGQAVAITAEGRPTGVLLVPEGRARRRRWVRGESLRDVVPLSRADVDALGADLDDSPTTR
ncbi:type II toxin-antitoxin system Phd/YefM family antitoxin [Cellulosimicrobium marinum]|uniref:type II toxin-antitoxin system Phd/YefM family antitoxin n=1 Tax=Cellulosimicrobium marinum TaxID=1638992 RepID=UPI001E6281F1|nr:type II toxin-antitoxin system Phd/YefM family antitoxin [Cellulosimicrobium marinum]MCB7134960.1 type II toxin-antitoxin system Phd/YefM family antitoxin [Cellulosimicrobium marinum]